MCQLCCSRISKYQFSIDFFAKCSDEPSLLNRLPLNVAFLLGSSYLSCDNWKIKKTKALKCLAQGWEGTQPLDYNAYQTLSQCQRAYSEMWADYAENNHEITTEVQCNYPDFKQKLPEEENFVISKVNGSQLWCSKCYLRVAGFQKLKTVQGKKQRIRKRKSSQKAVFSWKIFTENLIKRFSAQVRSHMNT